jgi:hypothetical protein
MMPAMLLALLSASASPAPAAAPVELGHVPWRRGFDDARAEAARVGKPVLVLFNEVPGCSTVNAYAENVLTDPIVVDAAALFVPVFVSNNDGDGAHTHRDRAVLARYGEPTWNNPVLRIVDSDGVMLAPRVTHDSGAPGLLRAMATALDRAGRAPAWLRILVDEQRPSISKTFACACFWEGEASLGAVDGVRTTEAGFVDGREVVRVTLDPARARDVERSAHALGYRDVDGAFKAAPPSDDKHTLARSKWANVAMTPAQRTRVNAALAAGEDPRELLAPSQRPSR